jgi:hypothetical protein
MVAWPNLIEYKDRLNIWIKCVIILECDKIATDALEVAPFLTHKGIVPHEAEGIAPALAQKPSLRPLVTRASNAWPEATWEGPHPTKEITRPFPSPCPIGADLAHAAPRQACTSNNNCCTPRVDLSVVYCGRECDLHG